MALVGLAAACARDNQTTADGGLDVTIGGIVLRVSSGTARVSGGALALYLTDQPDACLAVTQTPTGASTVFVLRVAPKLDGTTAAMVVVGPPTPGPGQAVGRIAALVGPTETAMHAAATGSAAWTVNADGTTTIVSLDIGFEGTPDRLITGGLTVPPCN